MVEPFKPWFGKGWEIQPVQPANLFALYGSNGLVSIRMEYDFFNMVKTQKNIYRSNEFGTTRMEHDPFSTVKTNKCIFG